MTRHPNRSRPLLQFALISMVASCGGNVDGPSSPPADSGASVDQDAEQPGASSDGADSQPDAWVDVADTYGDTCVIPENNACVSPITGCPSTGSCWPGGFACLCTSCDIFFEDGACSWTVENESVRMARNVVRATNADGGQEMLSVREPPDCMALDGYSVEAIPGKVTITLCPASCDRHRADPTVTFSIRRSGCPISAP
jgi:hypothetical protein